MDWNDSGELNPEIMFKQKVRADKTLPREEY
jgi:hypothetical protein